MVCHSIPPFNHEGLLPPFVGAPTVSTGYAPYRTSFADLVHAFGISVHRLDILSGFVAFRRRLFQIGIRDGFQWINGSFVQIINGEPKDIDVVTVFDTNISRDNFEYVVKYNNSLFFPDRTKELFKTDAYFIDVQGHTYYSMIRMVAFWFGLFSHTRMERVWKGILEILLPNSESECAYERDLVAQALEAHCGE